MKECLILSNSEKSFWYQDLDFRTGFLLSKSRRYRKSPLRPEVQQIVDATGLPLQPIELSSSQKGVLFLGTVQHIHSEWVALIDSQNMDVSVLSKQLQDLKIQKVKVLSDDQQPSAKDSELLASLKSSFNDVEFVSWR